MRILHLTDRLTTRGGAYRHLDSILRWQIERGHDVLLAAGEEGTEGPRCPTRIVPGLEARGAAAIDLVPTLTEFRPDVVHLHTIVNPCVLEWARSYAAVITVQDHRYFCPGRGKWTAGGQVCREAMSASVCAACFEDAAYFSDILALTDRRRRALSALRVVVLSRYMRGELMAAGVGENIDVIPPFASGLEIEAEPDGPPCVLFVGRLAEHKGVRDAVQAWHGAEVPLPLVMAGTGPLREEMTRAGVEVLGWLDTSRLSRTYRRARALVFPSRWQEPFGIAGLEALTMGVPVAAWGSGGVAEWHPGPGLVPWGDVAALAAALRCVAGQRAGLPLTEGRERLMLRLESVYRDVLG
jgi:glycosyltransferase involved in cell wall biosynthesis